ncbi:hypothetical protein Golob_022232, partial [Gossypium lobatum]|nr:hypothetical protein [Gossypium lobatum]
TKKRVNVFALSIYRLIIFLKDEAVLDLFDRLDKSVTPVPIILAKTFRSLKNYSLLKEFVATPKRNDILEEKCMAILQSLQEEGVERRAHWMIPNKILNRFHTGNARVGMVQVCVQGRYYKK